MPQHPTAMQFETPDQQREATELGMWVFLATEVLFFGGLFTGYTIYRLKYTQDFAHASTHMHMWIATANVAVLLLSSLTVALAVHAARTSAQRMLQAMLGSTVLLGLIFLGLKGYEYYKDYHEQLIPGLNFHYTGPANPDHVELFVVLYFIMTGLHALHVVIGVGIMAAMTLLAARRRFSPEYHTPVEISGLYWHFVDIIWIFLYPLLYLVQP